MIRFEPDTWLDAILRPLAMAVPGGGIYTEILAPDFRFVYVLALILVFGICWNSVKKQTSAKRALSFFLFCALSFVPWLASSGNGRYFMPILLIVGPLCAALLHHLPFKNHLKLALLGFMLGGQAFLLYEVRPWNSWGLVSWKNGPAFAIDVPQDMQEHPATYVTLTGISYSLIAPHFHPRSRWVNLSSQLGKPEQSVDQRKLRQILADSPMLQMVFPSLINAVGTRAPSPDQSDAIDLVLADFHLQLVRERCRLLPSGGLTAMERKPGQELTQKEPRGFWVCALEPLRESAIRAKPKPSPEVEAIFGRIEQLCPRMFPAGTATTVLLPIGARRFYSDTDMRLYVLNDGRVMYKYMRALNAAMLGDKEQVMASEFHMDCSNIRGRAGLPWDKEI